MLSAQYATVNDWSTGFQGAITLTNDAGAAVEGWRVSFRAGFELTQIWGARIVAREGDLITVENLSWNAALAPGEALSFGFLGAPGGEAALVSELEAAAGETGEPVLPLVSVADAEVSETDGIAALTLTLDRPSDSPVSVTVQTLAGSADAADFRPVSEVVVFAPGETEAVVSVEILDDDLVEGPETFTLALSGAEGATIADASATVTILSDDRPEPPTISVAPVEIAEGDPRTVAAAGWFSTEGSRIVDAAGNEVTLTGVNWFGAETTRGAPDGLHTRNWQDMMDQMAELGFNTIRLPFSNDALREGAEAHSINYALNPDLQGLSPLEIIDLIVDYAGEIGLRIILDNHRNAAGDGASSNGLWYGEGVSQAQWVADWAMLAERYADDPTVIGMDLSNEPHGAEWGTGNPDRDWRLGAEAAIEAIHEANPEVLVLVEGIGGNYWWGGNLSGVGANPVRLEQEDKLVYSPHAYPNSIYSQPWFSDPDFPDNLPEIWDQYWGYIAREGIAPVLVGEFGSRFEDPKDVAWMEAFIPYLDELGASWTFWSWNPNSGDTGGILADDWQTPIAGKLEALAPILGGDLSAEPGEGGIDTITEVAVPVTLSAPYDAEVRVDWQTADGTARAGVDYEAASGTLVFAPGETRKVITLEVVADTAAGPDRAFSVLLTGAEGGVLETAEATVTIRDDDDAAAELPALAISDAAVGEGDGEVLVELHLDAPSDEAVTATVTARAGTAGEGDYAFAPVEVAFAPGQTVASVAVSVIDDALVEGDEHFDLVLGEVEGAELADGTGRVTIADNDTDGGPGGGTGGGTGGDDGLTGSIAIDDAWNGGFVARGEVSNAGTAALDGWTFELVTEAQITNIWNATILGHEGDTYLLGNAAYNAELAPGQAVDWGFQAAGQADLGPDALLF
ncbi:hypothetical protein LNKW23_35100 [Paralimibaculum aggregatum]|uniref:cellulase n=1 Tax=Paralimibaculum aggregatum TaxID=3036245 RepID=A0ABQ6LS09_9RHOB|nr:cellulase family glycosylhydrolase [Limibaculum sp. NKW23]GMG84295.1 hypothetical protein LNKW23_35100 [Limibaculum sp. NKW23]